MKPYSVLLVDDEELLLAAVERDLGASGYRVQTAGSGQEAIQMLRQSEFDILLTDLVMTDVDGLSVLKEAKTLHPNIVAIIITGHESLSSVIDALRLGAADYLRKPYDRHELAQRLAVGLKRRNLRKKLLLYEKILPVCSVCHKVRDDSGAAPGQGVWREIDVYLQNKGNMDVSHCYCQECYEQGSKAADDFIRSQKT